MNLKKRLLMGSTFLFLLGSACMGMTSGIAGCSGGCSQGGSFCPPPQSSSTPPQSIINQCTQEHTVACQSQTNCQWTCSSNPNMPANGQCPANQ
ncbi:MAG: hypothetical protein KGL04_08255 [Elusimicrobia bacterium]|nr:hypothetical protein [Elusimicrobiota bacterium]